MSACPFPEGLRSAARAQAGRFGALTFSLALGVALALSPLPAPCQQGSQAPEGSGQQRPEAPASLIREGAVALGLEQVIEIALRQNLDIALSRYNAQRSANSAVGEEGAFDPLLTGNSFYQEQSNPTGSELDGAAVLQQQTSRVSAQLSQLISTGGTWSVTSTASRFSTNSSFATLNPQYSANLELGYNQPLLRDFGRDAAKFNLRVARNNRLLSSEGFRNQVMLTVESVVKAYWDLVLAIEDLAVRERSLDLANDLQRQNEIMVEVGTLAPIEITVAKAEVASRTEAIIVSRADLENAEDALLDMLNMPADSRLWAEPLYPVDLPVFEVVEVDTDTALRMALENRPELVQKQMEVENARLGMAFNKDQVKPQLDLDLNLVYSGLAGDEFLTQSVDTDGDTIPDTQTRDLIGTADLSEAYEDVRAGDFDTWSVALNFSYPLGNKAAKARLANSRLEYESTLAEMEQLMDDIRLEVRQAVRNLRADLERVNAARLTRQLREEQLDAERKKFEEGLSTNYQVLQFQRDLEDAQLSETGAVVDYSKSVVELKRITGSLLSDLGVRIVEPQTTIPR